MSFSKMFSTSGGIPVRVMKMTIFGAPGSGKGSVSARIIRDFPVKHIASGDLLRNQIALNTDLGCKASSFINQGQLVPDDVVWKLVTAELTSLKNQSYLLDGFPRTLEQAQKLKKEHHMDLVICLDVPDDVIKSRLSGRWIHPASGRVYNDEFSPPKKAGFDDETGDRLVQREDDKPKVVQKRLDGYHSTVQPILDYYKKEKILEIFKVPARRRSSFLASFSRFNSTQRRCFSTISPAVQPDNPDSKAKVAPAAVKKRNTRKRQSIPPAELLNHEGKVIAYATAEEYDLDALSVAIQTQGLYKPTSMPEDVHDVLHVSAKYPVGKEPREIYYFREGSVVFWNVPTVERQAVIEHTKSFSDSAYDVEVVMDENEILDYVYTDNKTRLVNGKILLNSEGTTDLEKYTFSNAMALSVKLSLWEAALDKFIDSIESITNDLKMGTTVKMNRKEVLMKMGELLALRHSINLSSDLLDTPDFYWDRENLETLYHKTSNHLNITKRTRVMNEKLNHCSEMIQLLSGHLNDNHHVRLEWMIIVLIMVEVAFECLHYVGR